MNTYEAYVKANNIPTKVQIQARDSIEAIRLLEGQYGTGNVIGVPSQIL